MNLEKAIFLFIDTVREIISDKDAVIKTDCGLPHEKYIYELGQYKAFAQCVDIFLDIYSESMGVKRQDAEKHFGTDE